MTSVFTEEHEALRGEVRRWADERLAARAGELEQGGQLDALAAEAGELGYLGAGYAESLGGSGGGLLDAVVVAEELGRSRAGGVVACLLAQAHLGIGPAQVAGVTDLAAEALSGGRPLAVVDGQGGMVLNARRASGVFVVDDARISFRSRGWRVAALPVQLGWHGADLGTVELAGSAEDPVAEGDEAAAAVARQRSRWWLHSAAAAVAGAWRTWEEARAYALDREAFGRPVGRFQVNRHGLADAATKLTAARQLVHDLALRAAEGRAGLSDAASAWWYATSTAEAVADLGLQLHGGYGYTMEYDVQRAWRDAPMGWEDTGLARAREHVLAGLDL